MTGRRQLLGQDFWVYLGVCSGRSVFDQYTKDGPPQHGRDHLILCGQDHLILCGPPDPLRVGWHRMGAEGRIPSLHVSWDTLLLLPLDVTPGSDIS